MGVGHRIVPLFILVFFNYLRWELINENKYDSRKMQIFKLVELTNDRNYYNFIEKLIDIFKSKNFLFFLVEGVFSFFFSLLSCFVL